MSVHSESPETAPVSTSLDLLESTAYPDPASSSSENSVLPYLRSYAFRHSGWNGDRRRVWCALRDALVSVSRMTAFSSCGSKVWVLQSKEDATCFRFCPDHCHDRFCLPCSQSRASVIRKNLTAHLQDPPYRMLTLTMKATDDGLSERIDALLAAFQKLRGRAFWKQKVEGGAAFLEVTLGKKGNHWHAHLHVLLSGKYMPQQQLSKTWLDITGDSYVVDIRLVKSASAALHYVTKYVTKPLPHSVARSHGHLVHAIKALRGRKLLYAFGTWHKLRLLHNPSDDEWVSRGHIDDFLYGPQHDERLSIAVCQAYQSYVHVCDGGTFIVLPERDDARSPPPKWGILLPVRTR